MRGSIALTASKRDSITASVQWHKDSSPCLWWTDRWVCNSYHLSVHGNDVASERAVLNWGSMAVGDAVGKTLFWARGHHRAWHAISQTSIRSTLNGGASCAIRNGARFLRMAVPSNAIAHQCIGWGQDILNRKNETNWSLCGLKSEECFK